MRIGLYGSSPIIGGAERYLKDLLWRLDRRRFQVTLYYRRWPQFDRFLGIDGLADTRVVPVPVLEPGPQYITDATPPAAGRLRRLGRKLRDRAPRFPRRVAQAAVRLVCRYLFLTYNVAALYWIFRRHPVDVLHINNGGYPGALGAQAAALAGKLAGCRQCVMIIASTPLPRRFPRTLERLLDRLVIGSVDRFVAMTPALGRRLTERRGVPASRIAIIPYGAEEPPPGAGNGRAAGNGGARVVMVAQFMEYKGHAHLLDAVARLRGTIPNLSVTLVGEGPFRPEIARLVRALGIAAQVEFAGYCSQDEVFAWVRAADVLALPSEIEGMPYAILHAMSLGKPVVATRVGGIPDCVEDGATGILVAPRDVEALARALDTLLQDRTLARKMGAAGRRRYQEHYTVGRMISAHENLYRELASCRNN